MPCAYLCRHSLELLLKYYIYNEQKIIPKTHKLSDLYGQLKNKSFPHYKELKNFIKEFEQIDYNGEFFRYSADTKLERMDTKFNYDITIILTNSMFLFNILHEYFIYLIFLKQKEC